MPTTAGPFLKWAGGKTQLLDEIFAQFPHTLAGRGYVEPFVGSGAVFFSVKSRLKPARCTLLDANAELINLWTWVRDDVEALIDALDVHDAVHNADDVTQEARKTWYYRVREEVPPAGSVEAAARFLYLNRTGFNGLHRVNSKGRFNVPMGDYAHPTIVDAPLLRACSRSLVGVTLAVSDFRQLERHVQNGDLVYLDPPYAPLSASSAFTAYATERFGDAEQVALRDLLIPLGARADWVLSNSSAPRIDELYHRPGWKVHTVMASRRINSKAAKRGDVEERLVTSIRTAG